MRPSLNPRLVNGPFDDPLLFIPFSYNHRAILFDLGDIHALSSRDILKLSHIFVTHTHMDHFTGFERVLRLFLGREKNLYIYGPKGFIKNIEGKLAGYTWNLVEHYEHSFTLHVAEVTRKQIIRQTYRCRKGFNKATSSLSETFSGKLLSEPAISVSGIILDHSIPCLGYSIEERFHINIKKDGLNHLGLETGPWIHKFKEALYNNDSHDTQFEVPDNKVKGGRNTFKLGELKEKIAMVSPGQKISYIADVVCSKENSEKIIAFVNGADYLFIETAFLDADKDLAAEKYHLTARQAGVIAGKAAVKKMIPFHFSPRYSGMEEMIQKEAETAYKMEIAR
ncbi:MAG: ribonuclease Z [Desulfobacterales bacterium]|nr:ribonuclease Z [Desulfobacterales bacterium]